MKSFLKSDSFSRKATGILLLLAAFVGVAAGATISATSSDDAATTSTRTITVCRSNQTNMLRYATNDKCLKTETSVKLNETGSVATTTIPSASIAILEQAVCDGSDTDTVANEVCRVGMTGPGRGIIFFVDYNDEEAGFDYLEAAPEGWGDGIKVNQGMSSEDTGSPKRDPYMGWCSNKNRLLGLDQISNIRLGAGASNTATADETCEGGAIQAVSDYASGSKTDWYLPSLQEAALMYQNLKQSGIGGLWARTYWTSTEVANNAATVIDMEYGGRLYMGLKDCCRYVRPVRAF